MNKYIKIGLSLSFGASIFLACDSKRSENREAPTEISNTQETGPSSEKEVELTSAQFKAAAIQLGYWEEKNLSDVIQVNGYTKLPPQNEADVTTFVSGNITEILINEGDYVKKGQTLAKANSLELTKLQEAYAVSKSSLAFLQKEFERQRTLRAQNVNSDKTYQQINTDFQIEQSRFNSLERQLKLSNVSLDQASSMQSLSILAPISGYIGRINIRIGSSIDPGSSLITILDNSKLHLDLMVFEKDLHKIQVGQRVAFNLKNVDATEINAQIFSIGKALDDTTKTVDVHANIDDIKENLVPGMFVSALIETGTKTVRSLPNQALVKAEGKEFIFTIGETTRADTDQEHYHFKRVEVKSGLSELNYTEIIPLTPIPENHRIVTSGAYYLQSHLSAGEGDGHAH